MYYPLTAWFVLFCNTVTSSHLEDLNLLKALATALMPNVSFSRPVTVIQRLCEDFIALSQSHFAVMGGRAGAAVANGSSPLRRQSLRPHAIENSAIEPCPAGPFTSDLYEMYDANGGEDFDAFDLLFPNTRIIDFSDNIFPFDTS